MDWQHNKAAIIGLIISANGFLISFTGYGVVISIIGLCFCLAGISQKKPKDKWKFLALLGILLALVSFPIAIMVSDSNLSYNQDDSSSESETDESVQLPDSLLIEGTLVSFSL